jgi:peptide-methionine (S)-S-oxide reductase
MLPTETADTYPWIMAEAAAVRATATLGGGCFWCIEAVFLRVSGVTGVRSGYAGGHTENPTYDLVCSGRTGHAEVVQVEFDPEIIGYDRILEVFWQAHDPTTRNRQGHDIGSQYRSIILAHDEQQLHYAHASRERAQQQFSRPIVTEIMPLERFHPAEPYHHDYYARNPYAPYCRAVIAPKLRKLEHSGTAH